MGLWATRVVRRIHESSEDDAPHHWRRRFAQQERSQDADALRA